MGPLAGPLFTQPCLQGIQFPLGGDKAAPVPVGFAFLRLFKCIVTPAFNVYTSNASAVLENFLNVDESSMIVAEAVASVVATEVQQRRSSLNRCQK